MKLKEWIRRNNMTQGEFAALIGIKQCTLSNYINGRFTPSYGMTLVIEKATKGEVTANDHVEARKLRGK